MSGVEPPAWSQTTASMPPWDREIRRSPEKVCVTSSSRVRDPAVRTSGTSWTLEIPEGSLSGIVRSAVFS